MIYIIYTLFCKQNLMKIKFLSFCYGGLMIMRLVRVGTHNLK